jgi:hypothetical protein
MSRIRTKLELELAGQGNGWTDVTEDLVGSQRPRYGFGGTGIKDRVANTGELSFALNNSATNSAQLQASSRATTRTCSCAPRDCAPHSD